MVFQYGYTAASNQVGIMALRGVYGPDKVYSERCQYLAFYDEPTIKNRLDFFENPQCDMYRQTKLTTVLPSASSYNGEVTTLRKETFTNIIMGVADVDTYDAYVEEWMEIGGSILTQEANEWYATTK